MGKAARGGFIHSLATALTSNEFLIVLVSVLFITAKRQQSLIAKELRKMETIQTSSNPTTSTATEMKNPNAVEKPSTESTAKTAAVEIKPETADQKKRRLIHVDSGQARIIEDIVPYHQSDPEYKETGFEEITD